MPETGTETDTKSDLYTEGGEEQNYYDEMSGIKGNPEILEFAKKYKSAEEAIIGGFNAEKKIGSSFRLPSDLKTLSEEQRAELFSRVKTLRDVPDTPDGYEITTPEGLPHNENLESAFRQFAHERGWDKKDVSDLMNLYHQALLTSKAQQDEETNRAASQAETDFRIRCGSNFDKVMENIKRARMAISDELGFTYTNDKGELCSKLDDCLDATGLGNKAPILMMLNWIFEKNFAEGVPIVGSGAPAGEGSSFFDYNKED